MLLDGKQGCLLCELGKHTAAQLADGVQYRRRPVTGHAVFVSKKGKIIKGFRVHIGTVRIKKAMRRKACEILLAGFQLICTQNTHGLVSPVQRARVSLPQHLTIQPNLSSRRPY